MRVLLLATDAYGGHGGIAFYNRSLAEALAQMPEVTEVVVVPRVMRFAPPVSQTRSASWRTLQAANGATCEPSLRLAGEHFDLVDLRARQPVAPGGATGQSQTRASWCCRFTASTCGSSLPPVPPSGSERWMRSGRSVVSRVIA